MTTVLVTGGNGFIGQHVCRELDARGFTVEVLDTRERPTAVGRLVLGDIRDETSVNEAIAHVDGVIHLAGVLGTQETINNPRPAAQTNILGGLNVFESCANYGVPLVNIAVGNWWMNNTYSITKSTMERFAKMYNKERKAKISVVRALNAYGPGQTVAAPFGSSKVRKIMPSFVCRALTGMPIEIYGSGDQVMDMIYVADVATVLVKTLQHTMEHGPVAEPVEAGSGRDTTVNDIAAEVIRATGSKSGIVHLPMRPGEDPESIVLGDVKTLSMVGLNHWSFVPLEHGVPFAVEYFREYLEARGGVA